MPVDLIPFLDDLRARQIPWLKHPAILGFLATTGTSDSCASVALAWLDELSPGGAPSAVRVRLRGRLPRVLLPGENITVSISRYERFSGFQIKTAALDSLEAGAHCYEQVGGDLVVHGQRAYTTHHGPYELHFYERVPFDEVHATVGSVKHGVLALGQNANISPRLVFHHELRRGMLTTYHGDGVAMKTYQNLCANSSAVMLAFDLARLRGYALTGRCEEVPRDENPEATRAVDLGFQALGFGRPNRIFRHECRMVEALEVGRAAA